MGKREIKGKFAIDIQEQLEEIKASEDWRERFMDLDEMMEYVADIARQEGLERGRDEGRRESLKMVILNLHNIGASISHISFVAQVPEEEVRLILAENDM